VAATYAQVEQTLPGVAYENNPLLQAQSPLTQQATRIAALEAEVTSLAHAATEDARPAADAGAADWMRTVQARIHGDIQAIMPLLTAVPQSAGEGRAPKATPAGPPARPQQSMRAWLAGQSQPDAAGQGLFQTGGGQALSHIHDITSQLAAELGVPVEVTQPAGSI